MVIGRAEDVERLARVHRAAQRCHELREGEALLRAAGRGDAAAAAALGFAISAEEAEAALERVTADLRLLALDDYTDLEEPGEESALALLPFAAAEALKWLAWHTAWAESLERSRGSEEAVARRAEAGKARDAWMEATGASAWQKARSRKLEVRDDSGNGENEESDAAGLASIAETIADAAAAIAKHAAGLRIKPRDLDMAKKGYADFESAMNSVVAASGVVQEDLVDSMRWLLWNAAWHAANKLQAAAEEAAGDEGDENEDDDGGEDDEDGEDDNKAEDQAGDENEDDDGGEDDEDGEDENEGEDEEGDDDNDSMDEDKETALFGESYPGSQDDALSDLCRFLRHTVGCFWELGNGECWRGFALPMQAASASWVAAAAAAGFNAVRIGICPPPNAAECDVVEAAAAWAEELEKLRILTAACAEHKVWAIVDFTTWVGKEGASTRNALRQAAVAIASCERISGVALPKAPPAVLSQLASEVRSGGLAPDRCSVLVSVDGDMIDDDGDFEGALKELLEEEHGLLLSDGHVVLEAQRRPTAESPQALLDEASKGGEDFDWYLPPCCAHFRLATADATEECSKLGSRWYEELAVRSEAGCNETSHGWFVHLEDVPGALTACLGMSLSTNGCSKRLGSDVGGSFNGNSNNMVNGSFRSIPGGGGDAIPRWSWPNPDGDRVMWPHGAQHTSSLIYLHGFTCDGTSYMNCHEYFYREEKEGDVADKEDGDDEDATYAPHAGLKVVLPTAPNRAISCFDGEKLRAWYDYLTDHDGKAEDELDNTTLEEIARRVHTLIDEEVARVGARNVFLGGASQGCCAALHVAATYRGPALGGVIGTQGHLLSCTKWPEDWALRRTPLRLFNGLADETMPWGDWVSSTFDPIRDTQCDLKIHTEEGVEHGDDEAEGRWVRRFLAEMLR